MEVSAQLHTQAALSLRKESPISTGKAAVWAPALVSTWWLREKEFSPSGNRTLVIQPVTYHSKR
jgi:hypothetical protein